jgi:hypothetical protein
VAFSIPLQDFHRDFAGRVRRHRVLLGGLRVGTSACKISKTADGFAADGDLAQPANVLANHWSTPVYSQGYIYGISGQAKFGKAPLVCVEAATGKVMWSQRDLVRADARWWTGACWFERRGRLGFGQGERRRTTRRWRAATCWRANAGTPPA